MKNKFLILICFLPITYLLYNIIADDSTAAPPTKLIKSNKAGEAIEKDITPSLTIKQKNKENTLYLENLFDGELKQSDNKLMALLNLKHLTRKEKIDIIWDEINKHPTESFEFKYLIDVIKNLKPLHLSSELTDLYINTSDIKSQEKILRLLSSSTLLTAEIDESELQNYTDDFMHVRRFFEQEIYSNNQKPELLRTLIINYDTLVSSDEYLHFLKNDINELSHGFSEEKINKMKLPHAMISNDPKELLELLHSSGTEISRTLYSYASLGLEHTSSKNKESINMYLDNISSEIFNNESIDNYDKASWIDTAEKVKGVDKNLIVSKLIESSNLVQEKAFLISQYDSGMLEISPTQINSLIQEIESTDGTIEDQNIVNILEKALQILKERSVKDNS
ncbi:hypothetical protein [Pseudoalteromonas arctica]|uniref:Uncharacterized protein n=1 Tax=Pseudoalteromonas arctica TaxID=394751 RepID=A0A7Y0DVP2_9GAMM|nr:hypothetical protein [Pseudoalteromonas arctica]NMM42478.1 hypothetical protein [Pseudoalteromonas arctica]